MITQNLKLTTRIVVLAIPIPILFWYRWRNTNTWTWRKCTNPITNPQQ